MIQTTGYMQVLHSRCECHDCTQARWKMSMEGQLDGALTGAQAKQSQAGLTGYMQQTRPMSEEELKAWHQAQVAQGNNR